MFAKAFFLGGGGVWTTNKILCHVLADQRAVSFFKTAELVIASANAVKHVV